MSIADTRPHPLKHGVLNTFWSNLSRGWFMECHCGFEAGPAPNLEGCGEDMDDHFAQVKVEEGVQGCPS